VVDALQSAARRSCFRSPFDRLEVQGDFSSGVPDEQGARPCPLHLQILTAEPPLPRAERRTLPTVAAVLAGVGFTGSFALSLSLVTFLAFVVCVATAHARDAGPTLPIESVLAERQPEGAHSELISDMAVAFPVATRGLRHAVLARPAALPAAYAAWLTQPIALIADDAASHRWLTQQGDALHALGASILVVRVASEARMRALRAHRGDLAMAPAAVPELVQALRSLGAAVYPLVILTDGRLQQDVRALMPEQKTEPTTEGARP